jgi:hypothetical protein
MIFRRCASAVRAGIGAAAPALLLASALSGALAACGEAEKPQAVRIEDDPALTAALADPIMTYPDLNDQNQANAAIVAAGPPVIALPPLERDEAAVAAALADAARLAGTIRAAPAPGAGSAADAALGAAVTAVQVAQAAGVPCAAGAAYSARWAAALPPPFAVYPRAAVREAAGSDDPGCRLRVAGFLTPVEPGAVIDFYFTRASAAGYDAGHRLRDGSHVLQGRKGAASYLVHARRRDDGLTEVDLVASGG